LIFFKAFSEVFFSNQKDEVLVDVIMCNPREERDVGLMLMGLSKIPRDILDRFEENAQQEVDRPINNQLTGLLKQRYIALKVVQLIKSIHREVDAAWGR
jgi:hypothetical protein